MVDAMTDPSPRLANFNNFVTPTEFIPSLLQDYLNVRGHVWGDVRLAGGPGGLTAVVIVMVTAQIHQGSLSKDRWKVSQSLTKLLLTMESC